MKIRFVFAFIAISFAALPRPGFAIGGVDTSPAPSEPRVINFPSPQEAKLENGLRVIVIERPGLPLLSAEFLVRSGSEVDPAELAGVASMTGDLLTKGTEKMSAPQIASAIESLGGAIDSGAHWDASRASVSVMTSNTEAALGILADVVLHPTFKQEEIDRLKNQRLDGLRVAMQQPAAVGGYVVSRIIFGAGEYGHAIGGTMETVQAIKRDDILKLYKTYYRPENSVLVLAGNITLEQGSKYATQLFGDWKGDPSDSLPPARSDVLDWKPTNVVVDMAEAGQAAVIVAKPAIKRKSPDYYAGLVANAALGSGFVSRLNREIRIKRGLSYGARSGLEARRTAGIFSASTQTKNQSAAEVAGLIRSELKRLGTEPVEGEELKSRQAVLTGSYSRGLETNAGFASKLMSIAAQDLPLETINKFIPSINAVTAKDVSDFAAKHFETPPSLVIVGKAPDFLEALKKDFPDVKVIPKPDLDLNRADLVKAK